MTKKIAISLPGSTLAKARKAVRAGRAPNLSNYLAQLIENASATETFDEMIGAWVRESAATRDEIDAAAEESRRAFDRAGLARGMRPHEEAARKAS